MEMGCSFILAHLSYICLEFPVGPSALLKFSLTPWKSLSSTGAVFPAIPPSPKNWELSRGRKSWLLLQRIKLDVFKSRWGPWKCTWWPVAHGDFPEGSGWGVDLRQYQGFHITGALAFEAGGLRGSTAREHSSVSSLSCLLITTSWQLTVHMKRNIQNFFTKTFRFNIWHACWW